MILVSNSKDHTAFECFLEQYIFGHMKSLICYYEARRNLAKILHSMAKIKHSLTGSLFDFFRTDHIELIHEESNSQNIANVSCRCCKVGLL